MLNTAPLARLSGWDQALVAARDHRENWRFRWGRFDCCLAGSDLIKAMTGRDPAEGLRGYRTRAEAEGVIAGAGGFEELIEGIARRFRCEEIERGFAARGDAVLVGSHGELHLPGGLALGVVDLCGRKVLLPGRRGWYLAPMTAVRRSWAIPLSGVR